MDLRDLFKRTLLLLIFLATLVTADEHHNVGFSEDPYLQFRPPFVRSLPVQILLTGVVLTLTVVLFIHLIFTAQYHWPLAPVNYVLQLSGVTTLLISLIATIHVVLSTSLSESENWPYMLSYIAVNVPPVPGYMGGEEVVNPEAWTIAEKATWFVMNASTSGLIQITHIQFLTLLYPSRLEKQLIFALLGPMAIVAAVMQLVPISQDKSINYVSEAVRNVCNATLSLLFTVALFIWGLLVNRKQAWRTDGGTAVFGGSALTLALISTALNFLYVHRLEEYVWLPGLMWAVVLWQSFLGWWWWVGAGSGSGLGCDDDDDDDDVEEKLRREAKRESRRREAKKRRLETRQRARKVWRDVTGAFGREQQDSNDDVDVGVTYHSSTESRAMRSSQISVARMRTSRMSNRAEEEEEEEDNERSHSSTIRSPNTTNSDSPPHSLTRSGGPSSSTSTSSRTSLRTLPRILPTSVHQFYASIRRAHLIAAQKQAAERVKRIKEMERNGVSDASSSTWGISNLLWRARTRTDQSLGRSRDRGRDGDTDGDDYELDERREVDDDDDDDAEGVVSEDEIEEVERGRRSFSRDTRRRKESKEREENSDAKPKSVWWWGPLSRWRLQDSTTYE